MLSTDIQGCTNCALHNLMPDGCKPVPGIGPLNAKIMIVGEALGADEAMLEEPFVGQCGQLLNKILKEAGLKREALYITNTVKCRPTDNGTKNRPPSKIEIKSCHDWLDKEIALVKPEFIVPLGKVAVYRMLKAHLKANFTLGPITGLIYTIGSSKIVPAQHPSWLMQYGKVELQKTIDIFKMIKVLAYDS